MKNKNKVIVYLSVFMLFLITVSSFLFGCSAIRSSTEQVAVETTVPGQMTENIGQEASFNREQKASFEGEAAVEAQASAEAAIQDSSSSGELYTQAGSSDKAVSQAMAAKLIKNGNIQIEVKEGQFEAVFFNVVSLAQKYNGYVSNSQSYSDSSGKMTSGTVVLRVEKQNFDAALNEIKTMGKVLSVNISVSDVTQEYVDNESRLKNLEAQQKRLLDLMEQSRTVKDSIEVQRELSNIEGQIEVIKGRQNYLDNLVAYSTIEVFITEPKPIADTSEGGFLGAVKRGARGALTFLRVATTVLIGISPLLVLAGIILIIVWQSIRARNRRRAKIASSTLTNQQNQQKNK